MEIYPSDYNQLDLGRSGKLFIRHLLNAEEDFGFYYLSVNPAMLQKAVVNVLITAKGIAVIHIIENMVATDNFQLVFKSLIDGFFTNTITTINEKLLGNKICKGKDGKLLFPLTYLFVLPSIEESDIDSLFLHEEITDFINNNCILKSKFASLRVNISKTLNKYFDKPVFPPSCEQELITYNNINSILQRILPEYTVIRPAGKVTYDNTDQVEDDSLVVCENDIAVKVYHLDKEQINIINKMIKGDQLILACAGSGKSVLLISKCFKAARMNPHKKFLITCFNRNLQSLYLWYINIAGLNARNVECWNYDKLCLKLLKKNSIYVPKGNDENTFVEKRRAFQAALVEGKIEDRFYGIFIDEVQMFEVEWYKSCFRLLENENPNRHIFVICGDKTQVVKHNQKQGKAPWNAGEGFPSYRGGNKNIRIEKNYRNCIEVSNFINSFAKNAKKLLYQYNSVSILDHDIFLHGQAVRNGIGVKLINVKPSNSDETNHIVNSIKLFHNEYNIPFDEIAVIMFNGKYKPLRYEIGYYLRNELNKQNIPYNEKYSTPNEYAADYGSSGVSIIKSQSVLGLDYRAVIFCGLTPLGFFDQTKGISEKEVQNKSKEYQEEISEKIQFNINNLYVACTRARDVLHIIYSDSSATSIYIDLLEKSIKDC